MIRQVIAWGATLLVAAPALAVSPQQLSTFNSTDDGWTGGVRKATGGATAAASDGCFEATATLVGGETVAFENTTGWSGDWLAAGITEVRFRVKVVSGGPVQLRMVLEGPGGSVVSGAQTFSQSGVYGQAVFPVAREAFQGLVDARRVFENVTKLRIVHWPSGSGALPAVTAVVGLDNVEAYTGSLPKLNEIRTDQAGADNDEYIELAGRPGFRLDGWQIVVIGDGTGADSGSVDTTHDLSGLVIPADGRLALVHTAFTLDTATTPQGDGGDSRRSVQSENDDNLTFLLVRGYLAGSANEDLDVGNTGTLAVRWVTEADRVSSVFSTTTSELYYGPGVGPEGSSAPFHIRRCPDGSGPWAIASKEPVSGNDTPGSANSCTALCGDGKVDPAEACDDGNTLASGGCSADCLAVSPGFECPFDEACRCLPGHFGAACTPCASVAGSPCGVDIDLNVEIAPGQATGLVTGTTGPTFVPAGGRVFMRGTRAAEGTELWSMDPSGGGTALVKELATGAANSDPNEMVALGEQLFFVANSTASGAELFKSDGTTAGTVVVKEIGATTTGSSPSNLVVSAGRVWFRATDTVAGAELWSSTGTSAGTDRVADLVVGATGSDPVAITPFKTGVLFGTASRAWFTSGGAPVGVTPVGTAGQEFGVLGNRAVFRGSDTTDGAELWVTNGTAAGTSQIKAFISGVTGGAPTGFTKAGNRLVFAATAAAGAGHSFWVTDGTAATLLVDPSGTLDTIAPLGSGGRFAYFQVTSGTGAASIWVSDGNLLGTLAVSGGAGLTATAGALGRDGFYTLVVGSGTTPVRQLARLRGTELTIVSSATDIDIETLARATVGSGPHVVSLGNRVLTLGDFHATGQEPLLVSTAGLCADGVSAAGGCTCEPGFGGIACSGCEGALSGGLLGTCSGHGSCDPSADCQCTTPGYTGSACDECVPGKAEGGCVLESNECAFACAATSADGIAIPAPTSAVNGPSRLAATDQRLIVDVSGAVRGLFRRANGAWAQVPFNSDPGLSSKDLAAAGTFWVLGTDDAAYVWVDGGGDNPPRQTLAVADTGTTTSVDTDGVSVAVASTGPFGTVKVFQLNSGSTFEAKWSPASPTQAGTGFGHDVAVAGGLLAVGAPDADNGLGAVYVFDLLPNGTSPLRGVVKPLDRPTGEGFGWSVDLAADILAAGVGESVRPTPGSVRVFQVGTAIAPLQRILAPPGVVGPLFGTHVALTESHLLVGVGAGNGSEAALFERIDGVSALAPRAVFAADALFAPARGSVTESSTILGTTPFGADSASGHEYPFADLGNLCGGSVCENGGTCTDLVGTFECDCPPGANGPTCGTAASDLTTAIPIFPATVPQGLASPLSVKLRNLGIVGSPGSFTVQTSVGTLATTASGCTAAGQNGSCTFASMAPGAQLDFAFTLTATGDPGSLVVVTAVVIPTNGSDSADNNTFRIYTPFTSDEDCANGADDNTAGGQDCADSLCAGDLACTDACGTSLAFDSGANGFVSATGLWAPYEGRLITAPTLGLPVRDRHDAATRLMAIPAGLPKAWVEVVFQQYADGTPGHDVFAVCVGDPTCLTPGSKRFENRLNSGGLSHAAPNYYDGAYDHVFIDVSDKVGTTTAFSLVFDRGLAAQLDDGVAVESVRLWSDVDGDGLADGAAPACDGCWDVDEDGFVRSDSPKGALCGEQDCDDGNVNVNPGVAEVCDAPGDEDCDGDTNGFDVESCGIEDCANGVDDNQDTTVDCVDPVCGDSLSCNSCFVGFGFSDGSNGWTATDNKSGAGYTAPRLFERGVRSDVIDGDGPSVGFGTAFTGTVASTHTTTDLPLRGAIARSVTIPAGAARPAVFVRYALDGEATPGKDVFGVCFNVAPSLCTAGADPSVLVWKTDVDTANVLVEQEVPFPAGFAGQTVNVVFMYDTVDGLNNANKGAFIKSVRVGSDADGDDLFENSASTSCDTCVDADLDGYGATGIATAFVAGCANQNPRDCDDASSAANPGTIEVCALAGDQDCDGDLDPDDEDCTQCGNGSQTGIEQCDDGNGNPGDGCSSSCTLEAGALVFTEIHVTKFDPSAGGEQWVEIQNTLGSAVDVRRAAVVLGNDAGQSLSLVGGTYPAGGSSVAPGGRLLVAFGPAATHDGLSNAVATPLGFELRADGDILRGYVGSTVLDTVDFRAFACELGQANVGGKGRSLMLSVTPGAAANDVATAWCLAGTASSYANSGKHFGSPGTLGVCAESTCDALDDDCDGATDELLTDADSDGTCDGRDCLPLVATCALDCVTNVDADALPDCRDGCVDKDNDGWGIKGGAVTSTCATLAGEPKPDCDDVLSFVNPAAVETPAGSACTNDVDDDCDGQRDCLDSACTATTACAAESCGAPANLVCGQSVTVEPGSNDIACGAGVDAVYKFVAPVTGAITVEAANLGRTQYSVFFATGACSAVDCGGTTTPAVTTTCAAPGSRTVSVTQGQTLHLAVDGVGDCAGAGAASVKLTLRCTESCTDGTDDDGDGKTDCADSDCVASSVCGTKDFDLDGATNAAEITCGVDPKNPGAVPSSDDVVDTDADGALNCVDVDDDNDLHADSVELAQCLDGGIAKNRDDFNPGAQPQCNVGLVDADCDKAYDPQSGKCGSTEQQCGDGLDDDADGKFDCADIDCVEATLCAASDFDLDLTTNGIERQCGTSPTQSSSVPAPTQAADLDQDGLANCTDVDDDGDGFDDTAEALCGSNGASSESVPADLDQDGQCDASDPDDDGDLAADTLEVDCGSDARDPVSTPSLPMYDLDGDGACDTRDADRDDDGWTNAEEDSCGTSQSDKTMNPDSAGLDVDEDGLCDAVDPDDDDDTWTDEQEALCGTSRQDDESVPPDLDLDGVCDQLDLDTDDDTWPDVLETQCGTSPTDPADNPTVLGQDPDKDLLCDKVDNDDDGDGWSDVFEGECGTDPKIKAQKPIDTDGDLVCDKNDDDDDDDGSLDATETLCGTSPLDAGDTPPDTDGDGLCDSRDGDADADADGWSNQAEGECGTDPELASSKPADADGDKLCDALETDDDADGWPDGLETACGTNPADGLSKPVDTDSDGQCDGLDTDDDGDGSPDAAETLCGTDSKDKLEHPNIADLQDTDGDTKVGCVDGDDDADGLSDVLEATAKTDPLDSDSDNDGLLDGDEDANLDGAVSTGETSPVLGDSDFDGLSDSLELDSCYLGDGSADACQPSSGTNKDTDGDGLPDGFEDKNRDGETGGKETNPLKKDTDGDATPDGEELKCQTDPTDAASIPVDKDGKDGCDGAQPDSDGDEIADGVEEYCGTDPLDFTSVPSLDALGDTDGDKTLDCKDEDDDGDAALDMAEQACQTGDPSTPWHLDPNEKPEAGETDDTDGDGDLDCVDVDDDNDGLVDEAEEALGGKPKDADSDDDGLSDGAEVKVYGTSPATADSDGDGVQDGTEVGVTAGGPQTEGSFVPDSDPTTKTDPKNPDSDNDSLSDGQEDQNANGRVDGGESDPLDPADGRKDTDGDGLPDLAENYDGKHPELTDPLNADSDGDGLSDKLEVDVWKTNALDPDHDGGGVSDGIEVENGTDPTDSLDDFSKAVVSGDNVFRCDTGGTGRSSPVVFIVLGVVALAWFRRRSALLGVVVACLLGQEARAQAVPDVNVEDYWPASGRFRVFSVEQSLVSPRWQPYGHVKVHGERQSLRVQTGSVEQSLLDSQTMLDLNLGVGLFDWIQLDVGLPVAVQMESADDTTAIAPVSGAGLGDLVVRLRGTIVPNRVGGFGLGMTLGMTAPTGDGTHFRGDPGFGVLASLIVDYRTERVALALNSGVRIRTESSELLGRTFGNELTYGLGLDVAVMMRRIDIALELFGRTPLNEPFGDTESTTLEILLGPKWWIYDGLGLEVAVGAGLIQGYGAPDFRFEIGLMWAPGYDDSDGDGIKDATDLCIYSAEDPDAFADDDGCPDLDNDNDNLADGDDKCPLDPEDKNGIDDADGCPDGDVDGDYIADVNDMCPNEREDVDGFEDRDGCPELDNDHDGIFDTVDACSEKPETVNGFQDRDGCPDQVTREVAQTTVQCRISLARVYFERAKDLLQPEARQMLDDVAQRITDYQVNNDPPLLHVYVSGHASEEGTDINNYDLSLRRALQVYDYLVGRGVSAALLARRGFGEAKPFIDEEDGEAKNRNRRVEFEVELGGPCAATKS